MSAAADLHGELVLDAPAALLVDSLTEHEAGRLHAQIGSAREAAAADIDAALEGVVSAVPPLLRGRVRRALQRGDR